MNDFCSRTVALVASAILATSFLAARAADPGTVEDARQRLATGAYQLAEKEVVKFIQPPFLPEREDYYKCFVIGGNRVNQGHITFKWDESKKEAARLAFQSLSTGNGTIGSAFIDCGELKAGEYEFAGNVDDQKINLPGDWIFRTSATPGDRLAAVAQTLQAELKLRCRVSKKTEDRDVIVVRGAYQQTKLEGIDRAKDAVHFYTTQLDPEEGAGGGTGTFRKFLDRLGDYTDHQVVDETESSPKKIVWSNNSSAGDDKVPNRLDQLMQNLHDQTNLEFKVEKRPVEIWVIEIGDHTEPKGL